MDYFRDWFMKFLSSLLQPFDIKTEDTAVVVKVQRGRNTQPEVEKVGIVWEWPG
jgi:hypothetical protein